MDKKDMLKKTTQTNLLLRLFVGGFLIYLAYEIVMGLDGVSSNNRIILTVFSALFISSGLVIGANSLYRLIKHKYYDPMTDGTGEDSRRDVCTQACETKAEEK